MSDSRPRGGGAPVRTHIPEPAVPDGTIRPGRASDPELPREEVAGAYRARDERRAIKVLFCARDIAPAGVPEGGH
ncbi:hypothetical protein [Streptomyces sp. NPDC057582]|uniref:hypothetical protein n=1 Tax=Streptomyces sp. NPDC057582 TaxID=3346174 RepID=UPI00369C8430